MRIKLYNNWFFYKESFWFQLFSFNYDYGYYEDIQKNQLYIRIVIFNFEIEFII